MGLKNWRTNRQMNLLHRRDYDRKFKIYTVCCECGERMEAKTGVLEPRCEKCFWHKKGR